MNVLDEFLYSTLLGEKLGTIKIGCGKIPTKQNIKNLPSSVDIPLSHDYVKSIYVDEVEKVVVVVFWNNTKEVVKCSENDEFDVVVGVALGIARHLFGTHTAFYKRVVAKKTKYTKRVSDAPIKEWVDYYESYCNWCKKNKKRLISETTFKKNKNKYLAKMKGEN